IFTCLEFRRVLFRSGRVVRGPGGRSWMNIDEAKEVARRIERLLDELSGRHMSIGVVTPYRAQADLVKDLLGNVENGDSVVVGTEIGRAACRESGARG